MSKYEEFKNISILDTGIINDSKKDKVYNLLTKNNITNLRELFILDDFNLIEYSKNKDIYSIVRNYQTKGIIKLLRTIYLKENLIDENILNSTINTLGITYLNIEKEQLNFIDELNKLGLSFDFAVSLRNKCKEYDGFKLIDIFEKVVEEEIKINGWKPEYIRNMLCICYILKWYYEKNKINDVIDICNIEALKEYSIKNNKIYKQELPQVKLIKNKTHLQ